MRQSFSTVKHCPTLPGVFPSSLQYSDVRGHGAPHGLEDHETLKKRILPLPHIIPTFLTFHNHYHSSLHIFLGVGHRGFIYWFLDDGTKAKVFFQISSFNDFAKKNISPQQVRFCPHWDTSGMSFGLFPRANNPVWVLTPTLATPLLEKRKEN